jgi:hypothetical protein
VLRFKVPAHATAVDLVVNGEVFRELADASLALVGLLDADALGPR